MPEKSVTSVTALQRYTLRKNVLYRLYRFFRRIGDKGFIDENSRFLLILSGSKMKREKGRAYVAPVRSTSAGRALRFSLLLTTFTRFSADMISYGFVCQ